MVSLGICRASVGRKYLGTMEDEGLSVVFGFCCGVAVFIFIRMRFRERHGDHWRLDIGVTGADQGVTNLISGVVRS